MAAPEDPTVVGKNDGELLYPFWRLEMFVQWTDNSVYQRSFNQNDSWMAWTPRGGVIAEGLAVAKARIDEPRAVVKGSDGTLWERRA